MDMSVYVSQAPIQVLRNRQGVVTGRLETQTLTGKTLARDARGVLVGTYDHRSNTTRDAHGTIVGTGNLLPALLPLSQ